MLPSIRAENISKLYRLGEVGTGTISHDLHRAWARFRGKVDPFVQAGKLNDRTIPSVSSSTSNLAHSSNPSPGPSLLSRLSPFAARNFAVSADYVWALKDINLEIQQGEIVGIIGRNGAGKSTLLKLLSRITEPTAGRILTKGRIASLLEVGTGFHPELTGRENIYLNGSILGMRRHEITKRLEEIVEFSGCARYIDTPVKRYSSGMTVRLGFAVAAHLECEVLIVDEVLAVGDSEFQRRCIGKMKDLSHGNGRTLLFVSHNMAAIEHLCQRGVYMEDGRLCADTTAENAVSLYLHRADKSIENIDLANRKDREGEGPLKITKVIICDKESGYESNTIKTGSSIRLTFGYESSVVNRVNRFVFAFNVKLPSGEVVSSFSTKDTGCTQIYLKNHGEIECCWDDVPLRKGVYSCSVFCSIASIVSDWVVDAFNINVEDGDFFRTGSLPDEKQGVVLFRHSWRVDK